MCKAPVCAWKRIAVLPFELNKKSLLNDLQLCVGYGIHPKAVGPIPVVHVVEGITQCRKWHEAFHQRNAHRCVCRWTFHFPKCPHKFLCLSVPLQYSTNIVGGFYLAPKGLPQFDNGHQCCPVIQFLDKPPDINIAILFFLKEKDIYFLIQCISYKDSYVFQHFFSLCQPWMSWVFKC